MRFVAKVKNFFVKYLFNPKWRCVVCGREIFKDGYFCEKCYDELPFNDKTVCRHCGRKVVGDEEYCSTCKNVLVSLDKCRSPFVYENSVRKLIKHAKFYGDKYLLYAFAGFLYGEYVKSGFDADVICYVPMTRRAEKRRGFNQARVLAEALAVKVGLPVIHCSEKVCETPNQKKLDRAHRLTNLKTAFRIIDKKAAAGKKVLIVDDVTTTGATAEALAAKLKNAGAVSVYLLTVASVPPKDGY